MKKVYTITFLDFDDTRNPLLNAGQARATYEVGKRLVAKGHTVKVISSKYPGYADRIENGIEYVHIGIGTHNIRFNNIVYILSLPFVVPFIKSDVIFECFTAPVSTLLSPLWTRIPVIAIPTSFEAQRFSKLYKMPFHLIERYGSKLYKYFLPYTPALDKRMKKYNSSVKSKIVPEGVDEDAFTISPTTPNHILFLGRYDMGQKGIDLLLHAYHKIHTQIAYPLVIGGHGPDKENIQNLVEKLGLSGRVQVLGSAYGEIKRKLMSEAICVAMPSRHEGFSLFSLESLAAGLPIAAFDIDGFSWAPTDVVYKAKPYDTDDYAEKLLELTEAQTRAPMTRKIKDFTRAYTWDHVVASYEDFIGEIVPKNSIKNSSVKHAYSIS